MTSTLQFRRVIFGLSSGEIDRGSLELSAEIANLLGAAIQGVFIEDEALKELAAFSRMREFDLLSRQWRSVDATRIAEDIRLAVRSAKQCVDKVALQWGIKSFFEVVRSGSVEEFLRLTHPRDILVISAPESPQESLTPPLALRLASHFQESLTTMLLPKRIIRHKGPVIVIASPRGDSTLRVAAMIAQATGERLILVVSTKGPGDECVVGVARAAGVAQNKIDVLRLRRTETQNFLAAVEDIDERMIILPRLSDDGGDRIDPSMISSKRLTPVMLVDPMATFES